MTNYLFVYGTLMKSTPANKWSGILHENSIFIGEAFVKGELYNINSFPGLVYGNQKVYGEIYEILNNDILTELDEYEDYDPENEKGSLFVRELASATNIESLEKSDVWVYYFNKQVKPSNKIVSGRFTDFLEKR